MAICLTEIGLFGVKVEKHYSVFLVGVFKPLTGHLVSINGWSSDVGWKKLYDRVPEHEKSVAHRES